MGHKHKILEQKSTQHKCCDPKRKKERTRDPSAGVMVAMHGTLGIPAEKLGNLNWARIESTTTGVPIRDKNADAIQSRA